MNKKLSIWEEKFSDNYSPSFFEKIIKSLEINRADVISSLLPQKSRLLVDIACGSGDTSIKLASRFDKVYGFDIARNRILKGNLKAKKMGYKNVVLRVTDINKGIPLKEKTASVVICEASLGCFYLPDFVLSEVHRILKKNGQFLVEVPNYAFFTRRVALLLGRLPKTSSFPGWGDGGTLHYFTYDSLAGLLEKAGFEVKEQTNSGVLPNLRKLRPQILAGDMIFKAIKK